MNVPMPYMPPTYRRLGCPGVPPPRVPEPLQWPLPLLLEKFAEYRDQLVQEVADLVRAETGIVISVNGYTGVVELAAADVGLGNVVDTGDSDTPVENGAEKLTTGGAFTALARKADKATTLAGYGITDAYTKGGTDEAIADAISAVKDSAPAAFDTLKEIADWIQDDQSGAAAMAARISSHTSQLSQLSQNKVDKVAGKGLSTNDYTTTEKDKLSNIETGAKDNVVEAASASAFPQTGVVGKIYVAKDENKTYRWDESQYVQVGGSFIDIVSPSTSPADAGKAADAKATGDALNARPTKSQVEEGWWSEWSGLPAGVFLRVSRWSDGEWSCSLVDAEGEALSPSWHITSAVEPESVQVNYDGSSFTATRHRVAAPVPTKPSDIGAQPAGDYLTQHQQLAPVYSEWVCSPAHIPAEDLLPDMQYAAPNGITPYVAYADAEGYEIAPGSTQTPVWMAVQPAPFMIEWQNEYERVAYDPSATSITTYSQIVGMSFSATRTIIGYTLGLQTTKPLAALDNPNFAPVYSASATYAVGALCVHGGVLYRCTSAISTTEAWNSAHWAATTVADALAAKQDTISDLAAIRSGAAAGATAYQKPQAGIPSSDMASGVQTSLGKADTAVQPAVLRYDLAAITTGQLQDRAVQKVTLNAASTTLVLPALTDLSGKVSDFGIDMVNAYTPEVDGTPTPAAATFQLDGTLGTDYNLIVPKGETWSDMTALAAGEMAAFYFTRSAFQSGDVPTWEVVKKVVEFVPVPTAP